MVGFLAPSLMRAEFVTPPCLLSALEIADEAPPAESEIHFAPALVRLLRSGVDATGYGCTLHRRPARIVEPRLRRQIPAGDSSAVGCPSASIPGDASDKHRGDAGPPRPELSTARGGAVSGPACRLGVAVLKKQDLALQVWKLGEGIVRWEKCPSVLVQSPNLSSPRRAVGPG